MIQLTKNSDNPVCKKLLVGYIHHLFNAKEMLGGMLLSCTIYIFIRVLRADIRKSIEEDRFMSFQKNFLKVINLSYLPLNSAFFF